MDFITGFLGIAIRWVFVYKCNTKNMSDAYKNDNSGEEHAKDVQAGLYGVILIAIISILIAIVTGNISSSVETIQVAK